jgi:hypothetical protein
MVRRWNELSGQIRLCALALLLLAAQIVLFAFPSTGIVLGSMLPIDPFHPWGLQFLLILLTTHLFAIAMAAAFIHLLKARGENTVLKIDSRRKD